MANALTKVKSGAVHADTVGLAEMAGLARGKLIYGDSSGDPAALAVGSNGTYLKSDGTDISWAAVSAGTTLSGSTDNQLTTVTGANAIQGEAKLTYNGDNLQVLIDSPGEGMEIVATGDHWTQWKGNANRSTADTWLTSLTGQWNNTAVGQVAILSGADTTNKDDGRIAFYTSASDGADPVERMRIDEAGKLLLGASTTNSNTIFHVEGGAASGVEFIGNNSSEGLYLALRNKNTNANAYTAIQSWDAGGQIVSSLRFIQVNDSNNQGLITFRTRDTGGSETERLRITTGGTVGVGDVGANTPTTAPLYVNKTGSGVQRQLHLQNRQSEADDVGTSIYFQGLSNNLGELKAQFTNASAGNSHLIFYGASGGGLTELGSWDGNTKNLNINGNLKIGTAGKGIDFSNQTASSTGTVTSNGEILDHYEEGEWTPVIDGLSNTPTYYNLIGKYTRIGNIVKCQGFIQIGATKPTFTNTNDVFRISGLPFSSLGTGYNQVIGNVCWQQIDWVGSSRSTYGHSDDTQLTVAIVSNTKHEFKTMGQAKYYMGQLKNIVFHDDGQWILEWDMTYHVAT